MEYTDGVSEQGFYKNRLLKDGVIRNFQVIGEATKRLSPNVRSTYAHIPWKQMAGFRDKLVHGYETINLQQVWDVVKDVLPNQRQQFKQIIEEL